MKYILEIIASLHIGGAEKVARDIGLFLDPQQYKVHYIVFGDSVGEYEEELKKHGCVIFHFDSPNRNYYSYINSLKKLIDKYHYHAIHAHTMFNSGWAMLIAKRCGVPVRITHAHSALILGKCNLKHELYEVLMRHLINSYSTELVGCGTAAGNRLFGKKEFRNRGRLILNGIDIQKYKYCKQSRDRIRSEYQLDNSFVIGHVGHLAAVKNQKFLIELMPQILKRRKDAKLLLIGDGSDRIMLEKLIEKTGIKDKVIFTGNVNNVHDYLSAMDIFAFPSLFEGLPLALLEVQANSLPCIVSDKVPRDVCITDLIHLLSLADAESWIDSICNLRRNEKNDYSPTLVEKGFSTLDMLTKITAMYE